MTLELSKLKISTKSVLAFVFTAGTFMQVPAVNAFVTPMLDSHPKLTPFIATIVAIWTILHNPQVEEMLGVKETVTVTKETVTLPPASEVKS